MRAVIRFLSRGAGGTVEQRDKIFEGDAITLGRATDQVLHLKDRRVALKHAKIFRRGDRVLISSPAVAGVSINGTVTRDAAIVAGDTVVVGSNTLKFFDPPDDFDLAFTFELDASARSTEAAKEPAVLKLADTRLAKRPWAWGLFGLVLLAFLIVPGLGLKNPATRDALRASAVLPDDGWWSTGALAAVHQNTAATCQSCHEQAFVRVRSSACLQCHEQTLHRHVPATAAATTVAVDDQPCTACHLEHNEPSTLVRRDSRLCAQCHSGSGPATGEGHEPATDFATAHPEFRLTLLEPSPGTAQPVQRRVQLAKAVEHSGLIFPHDVHLDAKGVKAPDGTVVMQCADCHQPEEGGARMQPISMERNCASCHRLDFDPAEPERTVPHGDPQVVLQSLVEYYSARYLEEYPDTLATSRPSRPLARPGVDLSAAERARALQRAREKALTTARDLFERRTCTACHAVTANSDDHGKPRWTVAPALLTQEWMPKARFDHARHSTTLTDCKTCHAAPESKQAADVLMPSIATCRECHGSSTTVTHSNRVPSDCTLCHAFHIPSNERWVGVGRAPSTALSP